MDLRREIAGRMLIGLPPGGLSAEWEQDFAAFPPAGVILFRRDFPDLQRLRALTGRLRGLARPQRLFLAMDEEGGFVSQLGGLLDVPPNAALLARGAEPGDVEWAARVTGERLRALGVDWVFAPVADVNALPANPVIGPRAYGTDAVSAARGVREAVRGFQAAGLACCLKHFPGHGSTTLDSHLALPTCEAERATLEARDLEPFRAGIAAGAGAVMTAHVRYPALDPERPATFSPAIVGELLRRGLGFTGLCVTDALEMKGATGDRPALEAARLALEAGCDLLLFAHHDESPPRLRTELAGALDESALAASRLAESRARLAAFATRWPEPDGVELARPLDSLTPPGWAERLERIVSRGLEVRGGLPREATGWPWQIEEPECREGPGFRGCLANAGVPLRQLLATASPSPTGPAPATIGFVAVASRVPPADAEIARLRALCRARPTILVGLQNDAFLERLPEAALRISAADSTPLTRRVVSRTVARCWKEASGSG